MDTIVRPTASSACGAYSEYVTDSGITRREPQCCVIVVDPTIRPGEEHDGYQSAMYTIKDDTYTDYFGEQQYYMMDSYEVIWDDDFEDDMICL